MSSTSDTVTAAIDAEIAALERDIEQNPDPRAARLRHLREVRRHYLDEPLPLPSKVFAQGSFALNARVNPRYPLRTTGRKADPTRLKALTVLREHLRDRTEPVKTSALHEYLLSQGITLGGENPANNLSALLYHAADFRSHGRSGWTLEMRQ